MSKSKQVKTYLSDSSEEPESPELPVHTGIQEFKISDGRDVEFLDFSSDEDQDPPAAARTEETKGNQRYQKQEISRNQQENKRQLTEIKAESYEDDEGEEAEEEEDQRISKAEAMMKNLKNREKKRISKERMVHEVNENHIGIQEFKILDQIPADSNDLFLDDEDIKPNITPFKPPKKKESKI